MFFKLSALTALYVTVLFLGSCGKKTSTPESSIPEVTEQIQDLSKSEVIALGRCIGGQQKYCEQGKKVEARIVNSCNGGYQPACADLEWLKKSALKTHLDMSRLDSIRGASTAVRNCQKGIETECIKMREIESNLIEWCSETGGMKEWCALLYSMQAMKVSEPVH